MAKHRPILAGDTLPQSWLDAIQELLGSYMGGLTLTRVSDTQVRVPAGSGNAQVGLAIMGKWRYVTANVSASVPGTPAAATYPVYATASANSFTGSGVSEVDATTYAFALEIRTDGSPPSADLYRQVGTVVWNGTKIVSAQVLGSGASLPTGSIVDFAGASAPAGWLICNGASVLRADYPELFASIGTVYGSVDGTHFTLPNLDDKVSIGAGTRPLAAAGGEANHTLSEAELPTHDHPITGAPTVSAHHHAYLDPAVALTNGDPGTVFGDIFVDTNNDGTYEPLYVMPFTGNTTPTAGLGTLAVGDAGSGTAHNNMQPFVALNKIIKT